MTTKDRQNQERDRIVEAACNEGRFARSRVDQYAALYDRDPEGTRVLLTADEKSGGLAKGLRGAHAEPAASGPGSHEAALAEASAAQMRGDLRGARDIMAAASPATMSTQGVPQTPEMLGLGTIDPPAASSSAPAVVGPSGVAVDAYGGLSYEGLPVSLAQDGTPRVHVSAGAMSIETLKSLGVNLDEERLLFASRRRMAA